MNLVNVGFFVIHVIATLLSLLMVVGAPNIVIRGAGVVLLAMFTGLWVIAFRVY